LILAFIFYSVVIFIFQMLTSVCFLCPFHQSFQSDYVILFCIFIFFHILSLNSIGKLREIMKIELKSIIKLLTFYKYTTLDLQTSLLTIFSVTINRFEMAKHQWYQYEVLLKVLTNCLVYYKKKFIIMFYVLQFSMA